MPDLGFLVAAVTGATAILASWVGNRGSTRAARIQAETARAAQQAENIRASRRSAYAQVVHKSHVVGDSFLGILPAVQLTDPEERTSALREVLRQHLRLHAEMTLAIYTANLEGPDDVSQAAGRLEATSKDVYVAIEAMAETSAVYSPDFDTAYHAFWDSLRSFTTTARNSIRDARQ
ncbi:hypothetical protein OG352_15270 [Streptomyces sp. NBC_01485]|uniref:hypothetical protein n=1 Tax=Streptomyces sp. NBC_01485 TaxID=2903884 RepID=UPI002E2EB74A|nr:hypothetical protein [Streptomyces sp. NBC_01485]